MNRLLISSKLNSKSQNFLIFRRRLKDIGDRSLALVLLVSFSWLYLILAALIRYDGGPIFYAQTRIGQNKKPFKCYKFRTMIPNAQSHLEKILETDKKLREEFEQDHKLKNDPRISVLGKFLRQFSLDELPQLWNILRGEMSFIGPRPIVRHELKRYGEIADHYLSVKPGLSGLWQVSGRNNLTYEERIKLDQHYVENWSLRKDFEIFLKTRVVVITGYGAY